MTDAETTQTGRTPLGARLMSVLWRVLPPGRHPVLGPILHRIRDALVQPEGRFWVRIRSGPAKGLWIKVSPRTGRDLYDGARELAVQRAVAQYLEPGMVFYDLGANVGLFTLIGASVVSASGKVFAFELDHALCDVLRQTAERNGLSHVHVIEAAVWSQSGPSQFVRADPRVTPDLGLGRILQGALHQEAISVQALALDDFVANAPLPDVVKCDVEGAELEVLQGARLLLDQKRPIIVLEVHSAYTEGAVSNVLEQAGYSVRLLDSEHVLALPPRVGSR